MRGQPVSTAYDISGLAGASGSLVVSAVAADGTPMEQFITGFSLGSFGSTARLRVRKGSVTGKILLTLQLADGQTVGEGRMLLRCAGDVYVQFVAGGANVEGSIWVA